MSFLGIDIGSAGCKAIAFDAQGHALADARSEYQETYPRPMWTELDPNAVWQSVQEVIREVSAGCHQDPIKTLAISCLGETFTPVGPDGSFLYNSITSMDSRAMEQVAGWSDRMDPRETFAVAGMPMHPSFTLFKILWIRENMPDLYARTSKFMLWQDAVLQRLGLPPTMDHSLAGRTMMFDVRQKHWSAEILRAAEIDPCLLSDTKPSGTLVGKIPDAIAQELGLPDSVLVLTGGHDQPMNALGAGVVREGTAADGMGTVECLTVPFSTPVLNEQMMAGSYCVYPHCRPGMYVTIAFNYSSGSVLRWFRDHFGAADVAEAVRTGKDPYDLLLADLPEDPTGILWVPHMAGSGTPHMDPQAKGAIVGLTLSVDRRTFIKALIEGLCYEMSANISALEEAGVELDRLRATGGGSRSPMWLQTKADVTGKPVVNLNVSECGCLAGAILGMVATREYATIEQAVGFLIREERVYEPDASRHEHYAELFEEYRQVYPALRPVMHRLTQSLGKAVD